MSVKRPLRVLVIDDSAYSRRMIVSLLERSPMIEVADVARDGEEALRKALTLKIDLITLDLEMPRMDGFTFLRMLMAQKPTPVLVVSGLGGREDVWKALELGAVDFVTKPTRRAAPELANIEAELVRKVLASRELRIDRVRDRLRHAPEPAVAPIGGAPRVVVVGASTGGPAALLQLFGAIPDAGSCAFLVAQHMPEGFTRSFAERLARTTAFAAREAENADAPTLGTILIAPGGRHLALEASGGRIVARITQAEASDRFAPSIDRLFVSAAKHYGPDLLAVVLTGMGDDGAAGALAVKRAGGNVIAESEETAVIYGMPRQAVRIGAVDAVLPLYAIPNAIQNGFARESAKRERTES
ncbi:MAG TPA: chemotaxis-specific protein-glutamate methyltransferase CheB [Myxococcota bacterium]|nr:chemotaxis-specific protein-glutamate methyltransferase CheB [Myxococcota bacterium]